MFKKSGLWSIFSYDIQYLGDSRNINAKRIVWCICTLVSMFQVKQVPRKEETS